MKIKELPTAERPYEKLELHGEKNLSDAELLAIIIKTGTKSETSVEVAQKLLALNDNFNCENLSFLKDLSLEEMKKIKGIGRIKAIQLKAICELATRMSRPTNYTQIQVRRPKDIATLLMNDMKYLKREVAKVVMLNSKNYIMKIIDIAYGSTNFANISIKEVLTEVIKSGAPNFMLVHNHPSGDSTPSKSDVDMTNHIYEAAQMLGIELKDHIVIGNAEYTSIFEKYVIEFENAKHKSEVMKNKF